jgi:hypothetical protein
VALAAAVHGAGDAAQAQAQRGFKIIGINHMSYRCQAEKRLKLQQK